MRFSEFAGLDAKMEQLMRSAQAGRIVHALLFSGPRGTGKKTMADLFTRAVLCQAEEGEKPCGCCPSCKKCAEKIHPDVHFVAPEKNTIKVGKIRGLTGELSLASYEGGMKIAVIDRADRMNESAQNALLKTLENPPGNTLFFLLTDAPGTLLPTVVSRCLQMRFRCLEIGRCAEVLIARGVEEERAHLLAALAQGSVGRALEIHSDEEYLPLRERVLGAMEGLKAPQDVIRITETIGDVKGREAAVMEILELWARDLMRVQNGAEPLQKQEIHRLQKSKYRGSMLLRRIMEARQQLSANLSWINVLEPMDFTLLNGEV